MSEFKPPWNFFPVHVMRIEPFYLEFLVGFDQGDLVSYSVSFYDASGVMTSALMPVENWLEALEAYLESIEWARWLTEIKDGRPRYIRLDEAWAAQQH